MVKLERFYALVVAAPATTATCILHGHQPNLSAPLPYCGYHIGSAICVAPLLHHPSCPRHSQPLYRLSYRGIDPVKSGTASLPEKRPFQPLYLRPIV